MNADEIWRRFAFDLTPDKFKMFAADALGIFQGIKDSQEPKHTNTVDYASGEGIKDTFTLRSDSSGQTCSTGTTSLGSGLYTDVKVNVCDTSTSTSTSTIYNRLDDFPTKEDVKKLTDTMKQAIEEEIKDKIREELSKMIINAKVQIKEDSCSTSKPKYTTADFSKCLLLMVPSIRHIEYKDEPGKEQVTVIFEDLTHVTTKCASGDKFDINIGVALAVMEKMFGSKTAFRKYVSDLNVTDKRKAKQVERKAKKEAARAAEAAAEAAKNAKASKTKAKKN